MPNALRIPSYRLHKSTGLAVVTLDGRDFYLGRHNSAASRAEYRRLLTEWMANGGTLPTATHDLTVAELAAAFLKHAKDYYRSPDGRQTHEVTNLKGAIRRLHQLYGRTAAVAFGPLALKAFRQSMIDEGLARKTINSSINR